MTSIRTGDTVMYFYTSPQDKHNIYQNILKQIETAFQTEPTIASTLHGQRKIFQGCYGRRTALFPSVKCGGAIPIESRLELAHAVILEQDPRIRHYRTQAIRIPLGQNQFCYPDFLIQTTNNSYEIHEVKPSISSLSLEDIEHFGRLSSLLQAIGIVFRLVDRRNLPTNQDLQQLLYWYQRGHLQSWSRYEISLATRLLEQQNFQRLEQIYIALKHENLAPQIGDYLVFHGVISIPFSTRSYTVEGE